VFGEFDHIGALEQAEQFLSTIHLNGGRPRKIGSQKHLAIGCLYDGPETVTERNGTQSHAIFDKLISINIPDMTPITSRYKSGSQLRILVISFCVRVAATRN
jgi:hypothetical protein